MWSRPTWDPCKATAGAAITAGQEVEGNADGKVIPLATGQVIQIEQLRTARALRLARGTHHRPTGDVA